MSSSYGKIEGKEGRPNQEENRREHKTTEENRKPKKRTENKRKERQQKDKEEKEQTSQCHQPNLEVPAWSLNKGQTTCTETLDRQVSGVKPLLHMISQNIFETFHTFLERR